MQISQIKNRKMNELNIIITQNIRRKMIYMFWQTVYEYKIYQFNENYEKELENKNGKKLNLKH